MLLWTILTIIVIVFTWTIKKNRVKTVNTVLLWIILLFTLAGQGYYLQRKDVQKGAMDLLRNLIEGTSNVENCLNKKWWDATECTINEYLKLGDNVIDFVNENIDD